MKCFDHENKPAFGETSSQHQPCESANQLCLKYSLIDGA